jgi:hypothetical protein
VEQIFDYPILVEARDMGEPVPRFLFRLFHQVEIRHQQLLQPQLCTR